MQGSQRPCRTCHSPPPANTALGNKVQVAGAILQSRNGAEAAPPAAKPYERLKRCCPTHSPGLSEARKAPGRASSWVKWLPGAQDLWDGRGVKWPRRRAASDTQERALCSSGGVELEVMLCSGLSTRLLSRSRICL